MTSIPSTGTHVLNQFTASGKNLITTGIANGKGFFSQEGGISIVQSGLSDLNVVQSNTLRSEILNNFAHSNTRAEIFNFQNSKNLISGSGEFTARDGKNFEIESHGHLNLQTNNIFASRFAAHAGLNYLVGGGDRIVGFVTNGKANIANARNEKGELKGELKNADVTVYGGDKGASFAVDLTTSKHNIFKAQDATGEAQLRSERVDTATERGLSAIAVEAKTYVGTQNGGESTVGVGAETSSFTANNGKTTLISDTQKDNLAHIQNGEGLTSQTSKTLNQLTGVNANLESYQVAGGKNALNRAAFTNVHNATLVQEAKDTNGQNVATFYFG